MSSERSLRRHLASSADRVAFACWKQAARLVGVLRPVRLQSWHSGGGHRVLCLAPHPDDETFGCGGTLVRHTRAGDEVRVALVTDGSASRALGLSPSAMRERRAEEFAAAGKAMGVSSVSLNHHDGRVDQRLLVEQLVGLFLSWSPELLYLPSRVDFHPDHVAVAFAAAEALRRAALSQKTVVRVYQVQVPLAGLATTVVSVAPAREALSAAMDAYVTQRGPAAGASRARTYSALRYNIDDMAEVFWEMTPAVYISLHSGAPDEALPLRGFRDRSFSDPLAYLMGLGARARLRRGDRSERG